MKWQVRVSNFIIGGQLYRKGEILEADPKRVTMAVKKGYLTGVEEMKLPPLKQPKK